MAEGNGGPQVQPGHLIQIAFNGAGSLDFRHVLNDVTAAQLFIAAEFLRVAGLKLVGPGWADSVPVKPAGPQIALPTIVLPGM